MSSYLYLASVYRNVGGIEDNYEPYTYIAGIFEDCDNAIKASTKAMLKLSEYVEAEQLYFAIQEVPREFECEPEAGQTPVSHLGTFNGLQTFTSRNSFYPPPEQLPYPADLLPEGWPI